MLTGDGVNMSKLRGYAPDMTPIYQADLDRCRELIRVNEEIASGALERAERATGPFSKALFTKAALVALKRVERFEVEIKQLEEWIIEWSN